MNKMNKNVFGKMVTVAGAPAGCRSLASVASFIRANVPKERARALMEELGACGRLSREVATTTSIQSLKGTEFGEFIGVDGACVLGRASSLEDRVFFSDLMVAGEFMVSGHQVVAGDLMVTGDLVVVGTIVVYGRVTVTGKVTGSGRLSAFGGLVTPGPLEVQEVLLKKTSWIGGGITTPRLIVKGELGTAGSPSDWV